MKDIRETLPDLRKAKGWSRDRLAHEAFDVDQKGTSGAQITAIERGKRRPSARTMAAMAEALEVAPAVFAEYRLALARHVLDEKKVGLDKAIENLEASGLESIDVSLEEIRKHSQQGKREASD
jgi:transcriptional regulator with XRE-family HTH domain